MTKTEYKDISTWRE